MKIKLIIEIEVDDFFWRDDIDCLKDSVLINDGSLLLVSDGIRETIGVVTDIEILKIKQQ